MGQQSHPQPQPPTPPSPWHQPRSPPSGQGNLDSINTNGVNQILNSFGFYLVVVVGCRDPSRQELVKGRDPPLVPGRYLGPHGLLEGRTQLTLACSPGVHVRQVSY